MASESGFTTQKKIGEAQHKTIHGLGSDRFGTSVSSKALSEVNAIPAAIVDAVLSQDQKIIYLEISSHGARKYDVLRISSGALVGWEYEIVEVIDADTIGVINSADSVPQVADTAKVMRWVTSKADSEGNVNFSPGPTQFVKDGSATQVIEDSAVPANNKSLPSQLMIYKDGVQYPVSKDTADAAGTMAVPVEIVGVDGTTINITAGDINVQLTDQGVNADVVRIGDGVTQLGITASNEAKVSDALSLAELEDINLKTPDLVSGKVPVDTGLSQGLTDAELRATAVPVSVGGTVAVLGTVGISGTVPVSGPLTNSELRASAVPVSGPLTDAELRAIALDVECNQLPESLGQKTAPNSLSVVLASGTSISATITGGATEAKQDAQITATGSTNTKLDTLIAKDFATSAKQDISNTALGTPADVSAWQTSDDGSVIGILKGLRYWAYVTDVRFQKIESASIQAPLSSQTQTVTTAVAVEFVKPVGAKQMQISNNAADTANPVRWTPTAETPTSSNGAILIPTAPALLLPAGSIKAIALGGNADITVTWFG